MNVVTLDTHAIVKDFLAAGFTEAQAEVQIRVLAKVLEDQAVTKADILDVRRDLAEIQREIEEIRRDVKQMESGLRQDMAQREANLRRDMVEMELRLKHDLTLRLGGIVMAGVAFLAAIRFFP